MSDKTEPPTPHRLEKARREGDSPVSAALSQAAAFLVAMLLTPLMLSASAERASQLFRIALERPLESVSPLEIAQPVLALSAPIVGGAAFAALAAGFVQTGGVISAKKLIPQFDRLNPATGLKNLFSAQRIISIFRSLTFAAAMAYLTIRLVRAHLADIAHATGQFAAVPVLVSELGRRLGWNMALIGFALAGIDVLLVRRAWIQRNRMNKDEIKREHKESEGDPEVKAARKRAHQEALSGSMIAAVKDASVLVVNPTHLAVALRYLENQDEAPRVVAQGQGDLALKMIDAARAYGVPVVRDVPVAHGLSEIEIGEEIPEALYEAVAEILREIWAEGGDGESTDDSKT